MRGMCARGLCLVAAFAAMGATAAAASAARPEFQVENQKTGVLEPVKKPVAFKETAGGSAIRSDSGIEMTCASSTGKGKLTGPKALSVKITYTGCETSEGTSCQSGRTAGEIKSKKLEGVLVDAMEGSSPAPAIDLGPPSGKTSLLSYKCGGTKSVITGHVLGEIGPLDEVTTEMTETYAEGEEEPEPGCGRQALQLIEGIGACQHLEVEVNEDKKPVSTSETKHKEYVGHVSLLK